MKILALSVKGKEYLYDASSARRVSARSAETICKIVNDCKFRINDDSKVWYVHDIDEYDAAYIYACNRSFTIRNGVVTARVK